MISYRVTWMHDMEPIGIINTTPFKRFLPALIPASFIDAIPAPITFFSGSPTFLGLLVVDFRVILIPPLRFSIRGVDRINQPTKKPTVESGLDWL